MSQNAPDIQTLGALRASGYIPRSISAEIRANLIDRLQSGAPLFEGIVGYDDTVLPDVQRALLAGHSMNLLGLRGQAKTRIARGLRGPARRVGAHPSGCAATRRPLGSHH